MKLPKLEQILKNVEGNLVGSQEIEIQEERDIVERTYNAYILATTSDKPIGSIAGEFNISSKNIKGWREQNVFSRRIKEHIKHWYGNTKTEKKDFAFLLGTY